MCKHGERRFPSAPDEDGGESEMLFFGVNVLRVTVRQQEKGKAKVRISPHANTAAAMREKQEQRDSGDRLSLTHRFPDCKMLSPASLLHTVCLRKR
jgi:hypothetical protein